MMDLKNLYFGIMKKPNFISYVLIPFTILMILNNFILKIKKKKNLKILNLFVLGIFI